MATLTPQTIDLTGLAYTLGAATAAGDVFANDGRTMLMVANASGGNCVVTINNQTVSSYGKDDDEAVTIANGETQIIGPFDPVRFNNSAGQVEVTYSTDTSVTVAVLKMHPRGW